MASFLCLVRFRDENGDVHFGEAGLAPCHSQAILVGRKVPVFRGKEPWDSDFVLTEEEHTIQEVLSPLARTPIFECIGLNYKQHAKEANTSYGEYPTVFTKPPDAMAGPYEDIPIHPSCLHLDYEAELCVVIKKDCKNLTEADDITDYILGYTAGNDVSSRWWQMPARSNNQHGVAKSFDKFAPLGPVLASPRAVPDPKKLHMECFVNGERRQETGIDDQIYDISTVLRHLSRGMTLRRGTVIMTGTPSGVAAFRQPPVWLQHGDVVTVRIDVIGEILNHMAFENK
ncbi:fumarylacetoacetate hydrolase family protein [Grosmannia clavigera kw1407]|uniref:Fumarylacetoacetate hydrolase family protein n=1 Tax=Grosmannia clavigera (strain kw1407 / UAMH 11150) TaxID=655863 RepID=F0XAT0_GROCL|nr:fumarylacetoacetate hydrolase family protein [Grosmannia clavigera kw1407]EFX05260.1 fumarylacetoacetate hydrolase family protein [Grosmannia clavigera kw1407]